MRPISIPRLELQAATLSVKMYRVLVHELTYKISKATFWSDSQTILQYINNESKRFQTYVANRVAEIREVTSPDQWRHCPGKVNPADDALRGLKPRKICCQHRWRRGPEFLWEAEEYGKPNGAKFKKQNCLHIQQIFYQGQERFQSSSPKSSHVQRIFFQGHGIF